MPEIELQELASSIFEMVAPWMESQNSVRSRSVSEPPSSPAVGDRYLVGVAPSGVWSGHGGHIAHYTGVWRFVVPQEGTSVWIDDEDQQVAFDGTAWLNLGMTEEQREELTELGEALAAIGPAQAAVDAAQQAALDASAAAQAAQASAIAAAEAENAAQESNIVSLFDAVSTMSPLITRARTRSGVQVEDYGSIVGSNFRDTINAAVTDAYAQCNAPDYSANNAGAVNVLLPRGQFRMGDTTLAFPGNYPKYTPGLIGEPGATSLAWEQSLNGPMISTGSEVPGAEFDNATQNQTFAHLELRSVSGIMRKGGFKSRFGISQRLTDVMVRGLSEPGQHWADGIGFDFRIPNTADLHRNHQHPRLYGCRANFCQTGFVFTGSVWTAILFECHANANVLAGAVYDSTVLSWLGGNTQGNGGYGLSADHWCSGTRTADHNTGWDYITGLPAGSGASLGVRGGTGNQFCIVTDLVGMKGFYGSSGPVTHANMWLELIDPSPGTPYDTISGLYKIEAILSATSCVIRKGSAHSARSGLQYQVRGGLGGNKIKIAHSVYHEGHTYSLASLGPDITGDSYYEFNGLESNNTDYVVDAVDVAGVKIMDTINLVGGVKVARIQKVKTFETDVTYDRIEMDSWSRAGVVARAKSPHGGYCANVWDSKPRASRYNAMLRERDAIGIYDARVAASLVRSGANISQWNNLAHASVGNLTLVTPGSYPQYVASDVNLGAPAVRIVGGASAAAVSSMATDITALQPAKRHGVTILAVARAANTTVSADRRILVNYTNWAGDGYEAFIAYHDHGWNPADGVYVHMHSPEVGFTTPIIAPADDKAHWCYGTTCLSGSESGGAGSELGYQIGLSIHGSYEEGIKPNVTVTFELVPYRGGVVQDLLITHMAIFARGITVGERDSFMDAARNEFPLAEI
jgi:hypothetical protein